MIKHTGEEQKIEERVEENDPKMKKTCASSLKGLTDT